jgi:hypothetical protein
MPFMVIYSTSDGATCFEQADAIDEAALFVERLRNKEGIDQIRIYRMEEISFAFRPYYKVELGAVEKPNKTPPPDVVGTSTPPKEAEPAPADPAAAADTTVDARPERASASPEADTTVTLPPPPGADGETAGANGRRGLFGR